jgi:hypothetical protein
MRDPKHIALLTPLATVLKADRLGLSLRILRSPRTSAQGMR